MSESEQQAHTFVSADSRRFAQISSVQKSSSQQRCGDTEDKLKLEQRTHAGSVYYEPGAATSGLRRAALRPHYERTLECSGGVAPAADEKAEGRGCCEQGHGGLGDGCEDEALRFASGADAVAGELAGVVHAADIDQTLPAGRVGSE